MRVARSNVASFVVAAVLLVAALMCARVATATTTPGQHAIVPVLITDSRIAIGEQGRLPRGVLATFAVKNSSSRNQNFTIFGKKTGVLKPGAKGSFSVLLSHRGIFPYRSTLDNARPFRGLFIVY